MTSLADRTISALRATHDDLAVRVPVLTDDHLDAPSAAADWTVAHVLSHLGSGAEIGLATLSAAVDGGSPPSQDDNRAVWARWDGLGARDQAEAFVEADARLVEAYDALTSEQRESVTVDLGFTPQPMPLAGYAGMRLNETAMHGWDVAAGLDPAATVLPAAVAPLVEQFTGPLGFLLGFVGKTDAIAEPAVVEITDTDLRLSLVDRAAMVRTGAAAPTARFTGPTESLLRLLVGRLGPAYTPVGLTVEGNVTLDDLRGVFPGF